VALESVDHLFLREDSGAVWEVFHENSKTSRYERHLTYPFHPSDAVIVKAMRSLRRVKPYTDRPKMQLPTALPPSSHSFDEVLLARTSARGFSNGTIDLDQLAKILRFSYGVTRDNAQGPFPRPFRVVPSGGALYPLELYIQADGVEGLDPGLYHYDAEDHSLDVLRGDRGDVHPSSFLVQADLASRAAACIFISAIFYRSTFKYCDRGYRFVLIEAGHLSQNASLCALEMGLSALSVGGYFDRDVDRHLGFDGLNESVVYILLVGRPGPSDGQTEADSPVTNTGGEE
jgi:SagB-type dehydrogenase family enzyme